MAIVLIAAGIALWAGKNGELNRVIRQFQRAEPPQLTKQDRPAPEDSVFSQVSSLAGADTKIAEPLINLAHDPTEKLVFGAAHPNPQANEFLTALGYQLRQAPALKTDLLARLKWNGVTVNITGQYVQLGQQSGQSRVDLQIGENRLSKVCDGRFLYSLKNLAGEKTIEFIDLRRIEETRTASGLNQIDRPTNWIATGGLASLLENLAAAFSFNATEPLTQDGIAYIKLEGTWNPASLPELLKESVPSHHLEPEIVWRKLPEHIPHQVSLIFKQSPHCGWFPYRIDFFRFKNRKELGGSGLRTAADLTVLARIQFASPQPINIDPAEFLQLNTDDIETIDNTPLYISQLRRFEMLQQQSRSGESETVRR